MRDRSPREPQAIPASHGQQRPTDPSDPSLDVVHAAIGFATAAVHGEYDLGHDLASRALGQDAYGFLDAVLTTIQAIADDADDHGADTAGQLREIGLGIHLAALDEQRYDD